jgi:CheY-like chemotaxis protein
VRAVCALYRQVTQLHTLGIHRVGTDEKTGIQALQHLYPPKPAMQQSLPYAPRVSPQSVSIRKSLTACSHGQITPQEHCLDRLLGKSLKISVEIPILSFFIPCSLCSRITNVNLNVPPSRVVTGTIKRTSDDTCLIEGEWGQGRLKQEYSRFRDSLEPLERLPDYQPGCQLQVYLERRQDQEGLWHLNERWTYKDPWSDLKLSPGDVVRGTVVRGGSSGYFVRLDDPDIEVWLPDREIPWADGSLGEEPYTQGLTRFILEANDRIQALITHIRFPPQHPAISLRRYLENLERQSDESSVVPPSSVDPSLELRFRARITGDLGSLRRRLAAGQPLAGKRVLMVDDDPATLDAMVLLLKHNGAQVDTVQVERSLSEAVEAIQTALRNTNLDLILIDYSLPGQGEGVRLASRVKTLQPQTPPIILFSGYRLDNHQVKKLQAAGVDGVMRKPLRLDGLLACLQGQTVWEADAALSSIGEGTHDLLPAPGASPAELLAELYRLGQLSYAVLLEVTAPHRLETVFCCGKFPSDPKTLESLLLVTDLRKIIRGLRRGAHVSLGDSHGNEALRAYSRHACFLALGGAEKPRYILGLGWEARKPPFTDLELRAYALLLEARLEQQDTWRWVRDQLPFLTQGQLLISLSHEIRARFSPWLNYQQALRAVWRHYPTAESDEERRALEADVEKVLREWKKLTVACTSCWS